MATYKELQAYIKQKHDFVPQSCWIADVKARHGLTSRVAPNRQDSISRKYPCPPKKLEMIVAAMRILGMIR